VRGIGEEFDYKKIVKFCKKVLFDLSRTSNVKATSDNRTSPTRRIRVQEKLRMKMRALKNNKLYFLETIRMPSRSFSFTWVSQWKKTLESTVVTDSVYKDFISCLFYFLDKVSLNNPLKRFKIQTVS
jgi:hypothetical protein